MADQYELMKELLSDRPIAFHPTLSRILGGVNEALIFQQLAYWTGKGSDPVWVYKTRAEFFEETTLTRPQQERARATLRRLGVITEERRDIPAKLYFRVNWEALFELLGATPKKATFPPTRGQAPDQPDGLEPTTLSAANPPTSKSTSESIKEEEDPPLKLPRTLEELEAWEQKMEERRRWIKGLDRSAD